MAARKTQKKTTTAVANKTQGGALVVPDYGQNAGAGWENTDAGDFQIPFLNLLQNNSPQCVADEDAYREDAKPGMFFNSVTEQLFDGDVHFVIALTQHVYVEWGSEESGGGFRGEHALDSDVVAEAKARCENPIELTTPEGNDLVETYKVYALLLDDPEAETFSDQVVISFSKTKIKRYKQIMTRLRTIKGSNRIPLFAHRLTMTPTTDTNPSGKKYKNVAITPAIDNDVAASMIVPDGPQAEILEVANALREAVGSGAATADYKSAESGGGARPSGDDEADSVFGDDEGEES